MYKRSTGKLTGFTEMGDIAEGFRIFSEYVKNNVHDTQVDSASSAEKHQRDIAAHVIVYMVRGFSQIFAIHLDILDQPALPLHSCTRVP